VSFRHIVVKRAAALAVACLAASAAPAQPATSIQERFAACMVCHGEAGRSTQPFTPSLAGQPSFYAITQLFLFREGRRSNEAMTAQAKGMTDDELRAFSDLIGKLPPPPAPSANVTEPQRMARGAALAQQHRCASCHGVDYAGGQQVARLAHQREDYLARALTEFRSGKRLGYTSAMNETLTGIQSEALQDVAHYLANLPKPAP
jgi:cytochrome c553